MLGNELGKDHFCFSPKAFEHIRAIYLQSVIFIGTTNAMYL